MIIERHMYCNSQEFFDVLVGAIIKDIYVSTDQKITKAKLKKDLHIQNTLLIRRIKKP